MMIRKLLYLLAVMLLVGVVGAIPSLTDYGNTTSLKINITPSMGAQTDYQIKFILSNSSGISNYYAPDNVVYTNGTTRPDWYDINVTDSSDTPLPFWVENNTAMAHNATVWVKVPAIAVDNSSGLKWRYGNSSQTQSTMTGLNTFLVFDDFLGTSRNTSQMGYTGIGTLSYSGGIATLSTSEASTADFNTTTTFGANVSVRSRFKTLHNASASYYENFLFVAKPGVTYTGQLSEYSHTSGSLNDKYSNYDGATHTTTNILGWEADTFKVQDVVRNGTTSVIFKVNDSSRAEIMAISQPASSVGWEVGLNGASVSADWLLVRKSVSIEPITSLYTTTPSSAPATPPVASFTCTPTTAMLGTDIACTDASTNSPTNWTYYWGDGNQTNGVQNPSYTYPFTGTFSVNQSVNNTAGSSFLNRSNYITITNVSGFTQQDLWQTGHYTKTLKVTDSSSNAPIPVVVVTDDNGQSYTTTNGTAYFTEDAGAVVFYFAATGYVSKSMSYIIDGDSTDTVQMVASSGSPQQNTWYTPWQVRIRVVDFYGKPLPGTNVTASYIASTLPSTDTSWLVTAYGISSAVATDMVNSAKAMEGTTDDNGGLSFTMFKSLQYHLVIANVTAGVASTKNLYPSDQEYVIYVRTTGQGAANNTLEARNGTLPWYSVNSTHINLNMTYVDTSLCTSQLIFRVWFRDNGTEVHNTTWSGFGASYVYDNHTVPKAPIGTEYLWGYNATTVC